MELRLRSKYLLAITALVLAVAVPIALTLYYQLHLQPGRIGLLVIGPVVAGLVLGGFTAHRLCRPVLALTRAARALSEGDLTRPLPPAHTHDELGELAAALERMRNSLRTSAVARDLLRNVINSLNEGLVVTDAAGNIRLANRAVAAMFGHHPEALHGSPLSTLLLHPQELNAALAETQRAESWFLRHDGSPTLMEVSRAVIRHGDAEHQVYVLADITQRKQLEVELGIYRCRLEQLVVDRTKELTAAVQELESFSYSVSHDLHAPLRAINGYSAALVEDYHSRLDEQGRDYLDRLSSATVRMGELIDGLLMLTRVVRNELRYETVDLSTLASGVADEIVANDPPRQATFRIAPQLEVRADRTMVRLLLQNLFGNAWKFTQHRTNSLIEFGVDHIDGEKVFFVRDNGAGFDPAFAQGLFRPFHRLHRSEEFPGTGIGLATVQRIVQRHGGWVRAEAGQGMGATFHFTLPDPAAAQVDESLVSARKPLSNSNNSQRASATR